MWMEDSGQPAGGGAGAGAEANPVLRRAGGDGDVALDALVRMDGRGGGQEPS